MFARVESNSIYTQLDIFLVVASDVAVAVAVTVVVVVFIIHISRSSIKL